MRIALGLQYDGAAFKGWQTQVHGNSVQDELEHALTRFAGVALRTTVAGRTDTGVHALGQVVHLDAAFERPAHAWVRGVNAFLPPAIAVQWAQPVPDAFHARFAAYERTYYYALYVHPVRAPLLAGNAGWAYAAIDIEAMRAAAVHLVGQHDFTAFRSSQCQAKSPVKFMYRIDIVRQGHFVHFRFRANAFLHHMVRNIMGCLIEVGRGRQAPAWMAQVRDSRDRRVAAPTFMPDGLYLAEVAYPAVFGLPPPVLGAYPWSSVWTDQASAP